jgi:hypothetical protein
VIVKVELSVSLADVPVPLAGLNEVLVPVGSPDATLRFTVQLPLLPLNLTDTANVAEPPGAILVGLCAPTLGLPKLTASVNTVCAWYPELWPMAVRWKRELRSLAVGAYSLNVKPPFASAVTV